MTAKHAVIQPSQSMWDRFDKMGHGDSTQFEVRIPVKGNPSKRLGCFPTIKEAMKTLQKVIQLSPIKERNGEQYRGTIINKKRGYVVFSLYQMKDSNDFIWRDYPKA